MKLSHSLGLSAFGLCAGLAFASGGFTNDTVKVISMLGVGALPASFISYLVADTKSQRLLNDAESKNEQAGQTLHKVIKEFDNCKSRLVTVTSQLESLKDELKEARNTINSLGQNKLENTGLIAQLQGKLNELSIRTQRDSQRIEYLESETEQWEFNFKTQVESESNKRFQLAKSQELERIYCEHDFITSETMQLFRRLQNWGEKVAHGHQSKAEIIKSLASSYNNNLDEVSKAISEEQQNYLNQIELLNERVAQLQQQLQGDLAEPLYGDFGFDINGKIANEIARTLFSDIRLPLSVKGFQVKSDGGVDIGYGYSRSVDSQSIVEAIKKQSQILAKKLGIFKITSVRKLEVTDCIVVSYRREPAFKEDEINRLWVPASKFESFVKKWERIRITAGSTGGKSPSAKNLALAILNSRRGNGEIRLYDPQHGSKKDYWDMPKQGTSHKDNLAGMRELCQLIDERRNSKNHCFVLYIFDELDNTISSLKGSEFKDLIKFSLKEGSHADIGVIYIGQSSDANEIPGFTHSNWNNAVQLHIGSNAGAVIEKLKTVTTEDKSRLLEQYKKIQEYCDYKNHELGLDVFVDASAYRFALVIPLSGLPQFIQLPDFDSYNYHTILSNAPEVAENIIRVDRHQQESTGSSKSLANKGGDVNVDLTIGGVCPKCGSIHKVKNGRTKSTQKFKCKDCGNNYSLPIGDKLRL